MIQAAIVLYYNPNCARRPNELALFLWALFAWAAPHGGAQMLCFVNFAICLTKFFTIFVSNKHIITMFEYKSFNQFSCAIRCSWSAPFGARQAGTDEP
jgi:hypothetical protein